MNHLRELPDVGAACEGSAAMTWVPSIIGATVGALLVSMGYGPDSWQYWAMFALIGAFAFSIAKGLMR